METSPIKTQIISPRDEIYNGDSEMIVLPGEDGDFAAMFEHSPLITYLRPGKIEVFQIDKKENIIYFVSGGFVKLEDNKCIVMVDNIKKLSDIDVKYNEKKIIELQSEAEKQDDDLVRKELQFDIDLLVAENTVAIEI